MSETDIITTVIIIVIVGLVLIGINIALCPHDNTPRHPNGCVDSGKLRNDAHDREKARKQNPITSKDGSVLQSELLCRVADRRHEREDMENE